MKCGNAESLLILDGDYEDALNVINMARSVILAASECQDAGGGVCVEDTSFIAAACIEAAMNRLNDYPIQFMDKYELAESEKAAAEAAQRGGVIRLERRTTGV